MTVATTDATVLIQGETGTGKELIARAVQNLGPRRQGDYVRFDCAAIPLGLLKSELFGHEKGAFTGLLLARSAASNSQTRAFFTWTKSAMYRSNCKPKLLRVLQEREFDRLGSNGTQQVNVRLVAATHRDLRKMVREGRFQSGLYFRLNIFPFLAPPRGSDARTYRSSLRFSPRIA